MHKTFPHVTLEQFIIHQQPVWSILALRATNPSHPLQLHSKLNQHHAEELASLRLSQREPPTRVVQDVAAKSAVASKLVGVDVATVLLHADKIVDVDVNASDVLR